MMAVTLSDLDKAIFYAISRAEGYILDELRANEPRLADLAEEGLADCLYNRKQTHWQAYTNVKTVINAAFEHEVIRRMKNPPTLN